MATGIFSPEYIKSQIDIGNFKVVSKRRASSKVWNIFGQIEIENGTILENFVCCRQCKNIYRYKGNQTTNLLGHKCFISLKKKAENIDAKKLSAEVKSDVLEKCASWAIEDCRPFAFVDGKGFKKLVKCFIEIGAKFGENIDVNDLVPYSTTISRHVNEVAIKKKAEIKPKINEDIKGGAAITCDLWTDNYIRRNYLSVTLHYVKDANIQEIFLALKSMDFEKASGFNIYEKMTAVLREFDITVLDNIVFVTDRGSNMISAFGNNIRLNCSNHLLNNVLEDDFSNTHQLQETISECKKLVKYFKKANLQHLLERTIKSHCATRWTSHYFMFDSIYSNWAKITEILQENEELHRLLSINSAIMKQLAGLCEKFYKVSKKIQGSQYVTLHYVHATINFIKTTCQLHSEDLEGVAALKENILQGVNLKWIPNLSIYHKVAFFLYPPTNQMKIFSAATVLEIKNFCIETMLKNLTTLEELAHSQVEESVPLNSASEEMFFSGLINDTVVTHEQIIRSEVEKYSALIVNYIDNFDVLKWWLDRKTEFRNLYKLSKQILCIPASSAPSERLFSMAGNLITEKRNKLYPKTVSNLIFLNSVMYE